MVEAVLWWLWVFSVLGSTPHCCWRTVIVRLWRDLSLKFSNGVAVGFWNPHSGMVTNLFFWMNVFFLLRWINKKSHRDSSFGGFGYYSFWGMLFLSSSLLTKTIQEWSQARHASMSSRISCVSVFTYMFIGTPYCWFLTPITNLGRGNQGFEKSIVN